MALTSLSLIKQLLNISLSDTSLDPWLTSLKDGAERTIKTYLGRDLESATYTEFYTGTNTRELVLRQRPVTSITTIHLDHTGYFGQNPDSPFASDTLLTEGQDYALMLDGQWNGSDVSYAGLVQRIDTIWAMVPRTYNPGKLTPLVSPSYGSIKVVYVAGYAPVPEDIQYATAYLVSYMKRTIPLGGQIKSETIGDYSYELFHPLQGIVYPEIATARQLLSRYREVAF